MESVEMILAILEYPHTLLVTFICLLMITTIVVWMLVECIVSCFKVSKLQVGACFR